MLRGTTGYPNSFTCSSGREPGGRGRSGGGLRSNDHPRHIEPGRLEAVDVRYDTPLSEHLPGNTRARTLSREGHSLHVEKNRKNIICFRSWASDMSKGDHHKSHTTEYQQLQGRASAPDIIHLCVHTGGRGGQSTPVTPSMCQVHRTASRHILQYSDSWISDRSGDHPDLRAG